MTDVFSWAKQAAPAQLMAWLNTADGETRFVGGCVRDSLLGQPPRLDPKTGSGRTDIDLATTFLPQEVMDLLAVQNVRTLPTGIEHGTVTAIVDHIPFEITTLRSDISTDGRRATVVFTKDWALDAQRRDFTMNALYLDQSGTVFDPVGGQADLKKAHVRFIGDPLERIKEDYLRILRFLRFSARFSDQLDADGWSACTQMKEGLLTLSKERIWQEMSRLFTMPGAPMALSAAAKEGVLEKLLPSRPRAEYFASIHHHHKGELSPSLSLAALWPEAREEDFKAAFKPSNADVKHLSALRDAVHRWKLGEDPYKILYYHGRQATVEGLLLHHALHKDLLEQGDAVITLKASVLKMSVPLLPIKGGD
ncbi:MAG: CCA tRNA nucleotidyltransferase, partial [Pseudomonadota bacterium]